ncbi:MAG: MFS transporter [Candidatus Brocadiia bacterium]
MGATPPPEVAAEDVGPQTVHWGRAVSWAFYDFANTIYSALVLSFAITLHVKEYTGEEKWTFLTMGLSLLASGVVLPFAGEVADRTGRPKRYLLALTLVCCVSCVAMSFADAAWLILGLFCVANFCFNSSLTFYDSLMPMLAPRRRLGTVSGLGVGLGYAGVAFALPLGWLAVDLYTRTGAAHPLRPLFALAGALFLLFSVPLFAVVPEKPATKPLRAGHSALRLAWRRVLVTLRLLPRHRRVLLFLVGNFFLVDTLNVGIIAAAPYVVHVFGLEKQTAMLYLIPFSLGAAALGTVGGKMADAVGARRTMLTAGICVLVALVVSAATRQFALFLPVFVILGGYGLASIWVAGRKLLVELVPEGQLGKYFGLYNVGHKLSVIGAVLFGLLADLRIGGSPTAGYRLGLLVQVPFVLIGLVCIYRVGEDGD